MKYDVVIGAMYGDEGKGKIVNYLSTIKNSYDYIFRVNASTNASHCVKLDNEEEVFVTKQLPSVFYNNKTKLVISPGAILNLEKLKQELYDRKDINYIKNNVYVASTIPLIIKPFIDCNLKSKFKSKIGSTNQGTGIAVNSRVSKYDIKLFDIYNVINNLDTKENLQLKIKNACTHINYNISDNDIILLVNELINDYNKIKSLIGDFCVDYTEFLSKLKDTDTILIEGCNGILLDNIHGVHPYVTSASTSINSLINGANLSPYDLRTGYIICGAYTCCLNKRPMPTELPQSLANKIYSINDEVDNAEGMKRRIGWLDLVALRKSLIGHKGCNLVINKLDVLKDFSEIKVCTEYKLANGKYTKYLPDNTIEIETATPIYKTFKGWGSLDNITDFNSCPNELKKYLDFIEKETSMKISVLGKGRNLSDIIYKNNNEGK